jgi:uncharacterized protein with HEPN domain
MKPLDVRKYLFDIAQACELLERFTAGKTFADYSADPLLRSGVERQFALAGEALNQALRVDPSLAEGVAGARRIIAFRNRLIHGYASVSNEVVWGLLETHLPALRRDVEKLLAESAGHDEDDKG